MIINWLNRKSLAEITASTKSSGLARTLGAFDLIMIGLGVIIGTGALVLTGDVAANYAGPSIMISYAIAGFICIFVALAYSELATMMPTSGSLYSYSYVAYGELFAWLVSGLLIVQLCFAAATVAAGWSAYVVNIIESSGIELPDAITKVPADGGIINLPCVIIISFIAFILYRGTKDSKLVNEILVYVKLAVLGIFVFLAVPHFEFAQWNNFIPFGAEKMIAGSTILFFAYTGFSGLACVAEECKNPAKDLKIGIIVSLILAIIVYLLVAGALTGMVSYTELGNAAPFANALKLKGTKIGAVIIAVGSVCAMTNVLLILLYTLSRLFYVIGRDGLVPKFFAKLHPKYDSPYISIIVFSVFAMLLAGFIPYQLVGTLAAMAAILDYIIALSIVILFRIRYPDIERPFKCPAIFIIVPLTILACMYLLYKQIIDADGSLLHSGRVFIYWFIGVAILYFVRGLFVNQASEQNAKC